MNQCEHIHTYLEKSGWIAPPYTVSFLAAGEYNENYLIDSREGGYVFRINHGSQLGLADQISYEFKALKSLAKSGVTPLPYAVDPGPNIFGTGVLLMEYVPGVPLDYRCDLERAAEIFARVHAQPPSPDLILQHDPIAAIAQESWGLIHRYPNHPRTEEKERLQRYHGEILDLVGRNKGIFDNEHLCIVNTEVNSGNFCINKNGSYLVDWEKAVISYRYQDLGHFLVPTTTLWKTDHVCSAAQERAFLRAYRSFSAPASVPEMDELLFKTRLLKKTIALRATAWCFMAWYEYTQQERTLTHTDTFERICRYLDTLPWIFDSVA